MLVRRYILVALTGACAVWFAAMASAEAAAIRGQILYAGPVGERKLPVTIDQYVCGKEKEAEDLVVGADKGIKNAVVWLRNPPESAAATDSSLPSKVEIDQKECVFIPRVVVVPVGGTVDFLNSDRLLHNVHSAAKENPSFNRTQPRGRTIPITFRRPEIVRVNCDLHSWMRAWVVVAEHPFYAVTNAAGEFMLPNVPPGTYTLEIWHETLGTTSRPVTVGAQDARVTVELTAPR